MAGSSFTSGGRPSITTYSTKPSSTLLSSAITYRASSAIRRARVLTSELRALRSAHIGRTIAPTKNAWCLIASPVRWQRVRAARLTTIRDVRGDPAWRRRPFPVPLPTRAHRQVGPRALQGDGGRHRGARRGNHRAGGGSGPD